MSNFLKLTCNDIGGRYLLFANKEAIVYIDCSRPGYNNQSKVVVNVCGNQEVHWCVDTPEQIWSIL